MAGAHARLVIRGFTVTPSPPSSPSWKVRTPTSALSMQLSGQQPSGQRPSWRAPQLETSQSEDYSDDDFLSDDEWDDDEDSSQLPTGSVRIPVESAR
jgi:hypothetical protein